MLLVSAMNRDPTELRRLYAAKEFAERRFMEALQKILSGDDSERDQLNGLLKEQSEAHKLYSAEAEHFVHWKS